MFLSAKLVLFTVLAIFEIIKKDKGNVLIESKGLALLEDGGAGSPQIFLWGNTKSSFKLRQT